MKLYENSKQRSFAPTPWPEPAKALATMYKEWPRRPDQLQVSTSAGRRTDGAKQQVETESRGSFTMLIIQGTEGGVEYSMERCRICGLRCVLHLTANLPRVILWSLRALRAKEAGEAHDRARKLV